MRTQKAFVTRPLDSPAGYPALAGYLSSLALAASPPSCSARTASIAARVIGYLAGVFNAFPNTSFSQNVGLISFTGIASRFVVGITGVFLIVLGLVPKVAAVISAMPNPVLGGAAVVLFGMIFSIGLRIITRGSELTQRNLTIIATSIVLGVGVEWRSDALAQLPDNVQVLETSGLIVGGVTALVLNAVLPEDAAPMGEGAIGAPASGQDESSANADPDHRTDD